MDEGFPLTKEKIVAVCDPKEYGNKAKYPYINYLPFTKPSKEYIEFAKLQFSHKDIWQKNYSKIKEFRACYDEMNERNLNEADQCDIEEFNINNKQDNNTVNGHKLSYKGSDISNGAIIVVHGGGYVLLSDRFYFGFAESVSKLTGCVVYLLNYKLAPEYALPAAVNELIDLYQYLLNEEKIPSSKICWEGGSCGGGMILLALQSIKYGARKGLNLPQPSCVWLDSPWTNLANDSSSYKTNRMNELMMDLPALNDCAEWAVGNKDKIGNTIGDNDKSKQIYSPINGDFNGLSPMYFMVGAGEILLDDSLICAQKAYNCGVHVKVDIEPYMIHVWDAFVGAFPETIVAHSRAAQWILSHFNIKSKL